jgi:hypothetical protein
MSMMCLHSLSCCLVVLTKDRESSRLGLLSRHCKVLRRPVAGGARTQEH